MEPPRMEQPWFEQPRMEPPRFEQPRMEPTRFEQPRMEPPCFEQPRMDQPWFEQPVDTDGKILSNLFFFLFRFLFFLDTDPHLASVVCVFYLFSVSRYELCVWGNLCTCVRMSTNLESPPTMGNFKV